MIIEQDGHRFTTVLGSDVQRDGMFLELYVDGDSARPLLEVFYSDFDGAFSVTGYGRSVPLTVAELFLAEARTRLPPCPSTLESGDKEDG